MQDISDEKTTAGSGDTPEQPARDFNETSEPPHDSPSTAAEEITPDSPDSCEPAELPTPPVDPKLKLITFFKKEILPFILEFAVILFVFTFVLSVNRVPSPSMVPTVKVGQLIFGTRIFDREKIERGDILTFESDELELLLVKRVIGLPGDKVEIFEDGSVKINGELLTEEYAAHSADIYQSFSVPPGMYFFMGDNRPGSWDARQWDDPFIPQEKIIAKVLFSPWPLDNIRWYG